MVNLIGDLRTLKGRASGYGGCARCKNTWNWKKGHTLSYNIGSGMFPLCEECWKETTIEEKKFYVHQCVDDWRADSERHGPTESSPRGTLNGQTFESILENAFKGIEWEAKGVDSHHVFGSEPRMMGGHLSYYICEKETCLWHKQDKRFIWNGKQWDLIERT